MCGICGLVGEKVSPDSAHLLQAMCGTLVHRGPDDEGAFLEEGAGLGMRRLAIIDLKGGHQPLPSEDRLVWAVVNGEIYNFEALRTQLQDRGHRFGTHSDSEVAVHAYEEWGEAMFERLNGMFAIAVWDRTRRRLLLGRDRAGQKPLYYAHLEGGLVFGSELKAVIVHPAVSRELDLVALDQYLSLEYVPSPRSILAAVSKLPAGHYLSWTTRATKLQQYWDLDLSPSEGQQPRISPGEREGELLEVMREAVRLEMVSDVPVGVFLSGGVDSSAVAALMSELAPGSVRSFSIGFSDPAFDESRYARLAARHLGCEHNELVVEPSMMADLVPEITGRLDEPIGDASVIPTFVLSRFAAGEVKVALGGDGGDELFGGYPTLLAHRLASGYNRLPPPIARSLLPAVVHRLPVSMGNLSLDFKARRFVDAAHTPLGERHQRWLGSFTPEERSRLLTADALGELGGEVYRSMLGERISGLELADDLNRVLYLDFKTYLEGDILLKVDRASMLNSLEVRAPLLNAVLLKHVAALPIEFKLRGRASKYLLKRALRPLLPPAILRRSKRGFALPVGRWLRGPLQGMLNDTLSHDALVAGGLLRPDVVRGLIAEHLAGRADNRKQLWTLMAFQRWHELLRPTWTPGRILTVGS